MSDPIKLNELKDGDTCPCCGQVVKLFTCELCGKKGISGARNVKRWCSETCRFADLRARRKAGASK